MPMWPAVLFLAGCGRIGLGGLWCDVSGQAAKIAGPDALDCADDTRCAADALATGLPFIASWDEQGSDSVSHVAAAFDGVSTFRLFQDGRGEVGAVECVGPSFDGSDTGGGAQELTCTSSLPEGNHFRVCGHEGGQNPKPLPFPR